MSTEERFSAVDAFEEWNDVADVMPKGTGYYYECKSIFEDADAEIERLQQRVKWLEDYSAAQENEIARSNARRADDVTAERECQCATYCMQAVGMRSDPPMKCRGLAGERPPLPRR